MSEQLLHATLKIGHSASLRLFICFRPKHIHLERLPYAVSTELALLQSNGLAGQTLTQGLVNFVS